MIEIGRLCVKIAGRDSRKKCVIVEIIDDNFVTIDGETRRRKCNIKHIEPLNKKIDIKKGASHDTIVSEFKKLKIEIKEKKSKPAKERPKKQRKQKAKPAEAETSKKAAKKEKKQEKKQAKKEVKETKKREKKK